MAQPKLTVYYGRFIDTPSQTELRIRTGAVLVSDNGGRARGVISKTLFPCSSVSSALEAWNLQLREVTCISTCEERDEFFFPGFIDTHIHAPQYPNAGIFGKSTLLDWLTTYTFPLESSLGNVESPAYKGHTVNDETPLARARTVYETVVRRTLSYGTTTASYFATIDNKATDLLAEICFDHGQRAFVGRNCMDHPETCPDYYRDESTEDCLRGAEKSIDFCQKLDPTGDLVAPIVTPRFALSCRRETLKGLGALARQRNVRIQTHVSENTDEVKMVEKLFPESDSYCGVYHETDLLTEKTILAHAIHLSDEEINLVKTQNCGISHCPSSNTALGSGMCPVRKYLDLGIKVGLGTDVSGGYSCSILDAVRQTCLVSRLKGYTEGGDKRWNIGVTESLWLATVGGAKVAGVEGKCGLFQVGMWWDVQQIGLDSDITSTSPLRLGASVTDIFGWESWEEKVDKWVWSGDDRNVKRVWVDGRLVHERSESLSR